MIQFSWKPMDFRSFCSPNRQKTETLCVNHYLNQDPYDPRFAPTYLTKAGDAKAFTVFAAVAWTELFLDLDVNMIILHRTCKCLFVCIHQHADTYKVFIYSHYLIQLSDSHLKQFSVRFESDSPFSWFCCRMVWVPWRRSDCLGLEVDRECGTEGFPKKWI